MYETQTPMKTEKKKNTRERNCTKGTFLSTKSAQNLA